MATTVSWCIGLIEPLVNSVDLTIFDRGFYSKDLMLTLAHSEYPYLIFVPKNPQIKSEIESMQFGEKKKILYEYTVNKDSATRSHMKDCTKPSYPFGMSLPQHA